MKRILFVISSLDSGGAERVLSQLANQFAFWDMEVSIILLSSDTVSYSIDERIDVVPLCNLIKGKGRLKAMFLRLIYLRKEVKQLNPDIVISFLSIINLYSCLALAGTRIPLIISERNDPARDPVNPVKIILRNFLYPLANGCVFQTEQAKAYFSKKIQQMSKIIPNPIKEGLPTPYTDIKQKKIAAVGRLEPQKNYQLLLKAFCKFIQIYPDYYLEIYGEGSQKELLRNMTKKLRMSDKVRFVGLMKNHLELIKDAKMFVITSDYEGMPNALMEAMAIGLTSISSDCPSGGPRFLIKHRENGLLFKVGDENDLLEKMLYIVQNENESEIMSQNAVLSLKQFSLNIIGHRWIEYAEKIQSNMKGKI